MELPGRMKRERPHRGFMDVFDEIMQRVAVTEQDGIVSWRQTAVQKAGNDTASQIAGITVHRTDITRDPSMTGRLQQ